MPDSARRQRLKALFRNLQDRALDLGQEADRLLYQPLHDEETDPVTRLFDTVDMGLDNSLQLVAGFRGTGKTTEFSRLEKKLWEAGYTVVGIDLDHYIDRHSPVDIRELLLILSGAVGDKLSAEHLLGPGHGEASFWERAASFLQQEVRIDAAGVNLGATSLKLALRHEMSFREKVREAFRDKVPLLAQLVRDHHEAVVSALRDRFGTACRLVVIVDSFEHVRGDRDSFTPVYRSVQELFHHYGQYLSLPDTHVIMSAHPFIALQADRFLSELVNGVVQAWPACHVRHSSGEPDRAGVERMVELVRRRGAWSEVLPDLEALETLVLASGGYVRDLLRFMSEGVHLAMHGVRQDAAERIIHVVKRAYLPLFKDEIDLLRVIAATRDLSGVESDKLEYVHRFLDSHLLLCYLENDFWYDVHPLIKPDLIENTRTPRAGTKQASRTPPPDRTRPDNMDDANP